MKYLTFLIVLLSSGVFAAEFRFTDTIYRLGSFSSDEDSDFIVLSNFESAGTCPLSNDDLVIGRFPSGEMGDRAFSLALAARLSGKKVKLKVDDSNKNSDGQCYVEYIEIFD